MNTVTSSAKSTWLNKVPEVTLAFWIIKIMSTTVGETGADFLAVNAGFGQATTRGIMTHCAPRRPTKLTVKPPCRRC